MHLYTHLGTFHCLLRINPEKCCVQIKGISHHRDLPTDSFSTKNGMIQFHFTNPVPQHFFRLSSLLSVKVTLSLFKFAFIQ